MSQVAHPLPRSSHLRDTTPLEGSAIVDGWERITSAERAVLQLLCEGLTNPQIAERLTLSPRTVQRHLYKIFRKVGVHSRTELVAEAVRREQQT